MPNLTAAAAAAYAAILDPERKVPGWWTWSPNCSMGGHCWDFTGPDDLHTAREHAWRGEEWLVNRGYQITTFKDTTVQLRTKGSIHDPISRNKNHAAAIAEAVRRMNDGD